VTSAVTAITTLARTILTAVTQQNEATAEIARGAADAAASSQRVAGTIESVTKAAGETGAGAGQVLTVASDFARQAEELRSRLDVFVRDMRAA
jgi:methyl-accepting chemotaxis protein